LKILYLLTCDLAGTGAALRDEHAREHEVEVVDLRREKDFDRVVGKIDAADRVICW
jgi:hypothetical protein